MIVRIGYCRALDTMAEDGGIGDLVVTVNRLSVSKLERSALLLSVSTARDKMGIIARNVLGRVFASRAAETKLQSVW